MTAPASHRAAARDALQKAARILLAEGLPHASAALNAVIETRFPEPPTSIDAHRNDRCTFTTCPCPSRCRPVGCIQQPQCAQLALEEPARV